jgi:hypothetical protein
MFFVDRFPQFKEIEQMTRAVFAVGDHAEKWGSESDIESLVSESHAEVSRRNPKVRCYLARITPALAELMLETNIRNRKIMERHVDVLSQTLTAKDMRLNGESLIFSSEGNLLDGQHRLHACKKSGVAFDAVVVFGISPKAFDTIDGGKARSAGDFLGLSEVAKPDRVASALQALVSFVDNGGFLVGSCSSGSVRKLTPPLAARVLSAHPEIVGSVNAMNTNRLMRTQHGYALHYIFGLVDKSLAADFAGILANGSNDIFRPFCRLRECLINTPMTTENRGICAAKAVLAFNAERSGERPKIIRVGKDWPTVDGLDFQSLARSIV